MLFSERSATGQTEENAYTQALRARRESGTEILDLALSNPTKAQLPYATDEILDALASPSALVYEPDPRGWIGAREALVAAELAPSVDRVFITASTSEAYGHLFTLLTDPGDEVLVPAPSYPLLAHLAHLAGVSLVPYSCRYDGQWSFDTAELWEAISDRTRAIVAVSPNNPTGHYLGSAELEALTSLGVPLIVDEVFHAYPIEAPEDRPRAASFAGSTTESLVFGLDGASKRLALPQLKLGWISVAGESAAVENACARLELIMDTYLSPSTSQHALPLLLPLDGAASAIRERIASNLEVLRSACEGTAASVPRVEGGWYAPVRMPATRTDEAWAIALIEAGVSVHPGYFYDFPDNEAWLVLSLLAPPDVFSRGVDQLARLAR